MLSFGMVCESEEVTTVVGTKGRLRIESPGHCPTKLSVTVKGEGRGQKNAHAALGWKKIGGRINAAAGDDAGHF